jgi:hypothetical protein
MKKLASSEVLSNQGTTDSISKTFSREVILDGRSSHTQLRL